MPISITGLVRPCFFIIPLSVALLILTPAHANVPQPQEQTNTATTQPCEHQHIFRLRSTGRTHGLCRQTGGGK